MRQFISREFPDKKGLLRICGKDFRYLRQVLRLKPGDMLSVRFSDGTLQNTTVCSVDENSREILLQICGKSENFETLDVTRGTKADEIQNSCPQIEYFLFQYISKPAKMEQIIRQATECGVKYVIPVCGEFSQKQNILSMQHSKKERIERIVREARQQSGSPVETEILEPVSTENAISFWQEKKSFGSSGSLEQNSVAVVLWERNEKTVSLKKIFQPENSEKIKKIAIVVGCEGGISPAEVDLFLSAGFNAIHFPGNILRCETAALYGIAAVQSALNQ
ncbi:MAG: RsmE family RNA methyltransferase [Treponema sp.]|jgi:16S rRNA (uracil1498-N3)-methyltransferase|nr:RsmE family RNA methyltransferase [Treponema sp.]